MQSKIYDTQDFRVSEGHMTCRCQGLFPTAPHEKGKAVGTRLGNIVRPLPFPLRGLGEHVDDHWVKLGFETDPFLD